MQSDNVFHVALDTLNRAGKVGGINERVLELLQGPQRIQNMRIPLKLEGGGFEVFQAYRVHYCDALGPFRDGTRIRPDLSLDEIKALGLFMTIKHCAAAIPAGGAKGGIKADPAKLTPTDMERLVRAFIRHLAPSGPWADVPGADIGTGEQAMAWMLDEYEQIHQVHAPAALNDKPPILGGSQGGEAATGVGAFMVLTQAAADRGIEVSGGTAGIQGFGQVGSVVAELLHEAGCKVIAVSDVHGGIHAEGGLDIPALRAHLNEKGSLEGFVGAAPLTNEALLTLPCDFLVPAAVQSVIHKGNAAGVSTKMIVEGANGPVTTEADAILNQRKIAVIPDVVANCGGATVCHFERIQGLTDSYWDLETVNRKLEERILAAYRDAAETAKALDVDLRTGAWVHALRKLERALKLRGRV